MDMCRCRWVRKKTMGINISMNAVTATITMGSHIHVAISNYMDENTNNNQTNDFSLLQTIHVEEMLVGLGVTAHTIAHTVFISRLLTAESTMPNP